MSALRGLLLRLSPPPPLRPPGARPEAALIALCIRCGRCAAACPYRAIRSAGGLQGAGAGTPIVVARERPCLLCMRCPPSCPTGALDASVTEARAVRMGRARVREDRCYAHQGVLCRTCLDECPFEGEAIVQDAELRPVVTERCVGCGLCEARCPAPGAAISVAPPGGRGVTASAGAARTAPRWGRLRRACQLSVAALYLAVPFANGAGHREVLGSLASTRLGPIDLVEPAAAIGAALAGGTSARLGALLAGAAPPVLLAVVLGPVFCAWICPFGLLSEVIDRIRRRRPPWPRDAHARLRRPRAAALAAVFALSALLAVPLAAILHGPRAVTVAALEQLYLGAVSPFAAAVLGALLALDALLPRRLFCRALCPAGAVANYLRTPRTLRIAHDPERCACPELPRCQAACTWGVDPRSATRFDGCTSCLACVEACPSGALRPSFSRRAHPRGAQ